MFLSGGVTTTTSYALLNHLFANVAAAHSKTPPSLTIHVLFFLLYQLAGKYY